MFRFFVLSLAFSTGETETAEVQTGLDDAATLTDSAASRLDRETHAVAQDVQELATAKSLQRQRERKVKEDKTAIKRAKRELKEARKAKSHDNKAHADARILKEDEQEVKKAKLSVDAWKAMKSQDKLLLSDAKKQARDAKDHVKRDKRTLKEEKKFLKKASKSVEADEQDEQMQQPLEARGDVDVVQEDMQTASQSPRTGVMCWVVGC